MNIALIAEIRYMNRFMIPTDAFQNAQNLLFPDIFAGKAVIANDKIASIQNLCDAVEDILTVVPLKQDSVIFFAAAICAFLNAHDVPALTEEREHADAFIRIDDAAVFLEFLFKCRHGFIPE